MQVKTKLAKHLTGQTLDVNLVEDLFIQQPQGHPNPSPR